MGEYINKIRLLRGPGNAVTGYAIGLNLTKLETVLGVAPATAAFAFAAFPNPTSRQVTLRYELPARQKVRLVLTDMLGRQVATVFDETQAAGPHERVYTLPAGLSNNLVRFTLSSSKGQTTLPVSVQP